MARTKERQHVKINTELRDGRPRYVVVWYPDGKRTKGGVRKRKVFSDPKLANEEADKIERALGRGVGHLAAVEREVAAAVAMRDQLAPGVSIPELLRRLLSGEKAASAKHTALVPQVCTEFAATRADNPAEFGKFQIRDVKKHTRRLAAAFPKRNYGSLSNQDYEKFLKETIGGSGKNRMNHLITYRAMARWARDKRDYLPLGPTAAENCPNPKVVSTEHEVYTPNEFKRLLIAAPTKMVMFYVLGQLAGIRAEERKRVRWKHWRAEEDGSFVLPPEITKTGKRRRVDVCPALSLWLAAFRTEPEDFIVPIRKPEEHQGVVRRAAGVPDKYNALRAGFASYHLELHGNPALTAKNDGHTEDQLEDYKSISGVTKAVAEEMFDTTPQAVLKFAIENNLPTPEWANRILTVVEATA